MRAVRFHRYGPPDVLAVEQVPVPVIGPREILVEVHAAAVNPIDCKIRSGLQRAVIRVALPWTLGLDVSGVVAATGAEVTRFRTGDEVYGSPPHTRPGAYAEYLAVDADLLARKPAKLSHVEAAAVPLTALTAEQALDAGSVGPGSRVLVLAGSGGVGTMAVQLARRRGANVVATTSADAELVRGLGAERVIDYRTTDVWGDVADLDFVLSTLGHGERERALAAVKRGGTVVSLVADIPDLAERFGPVLGLAVAGAATGRFWLLGRLRGRRAIQLTRRSDGRALEALTPLLEAGAIRPVVDRVLPLDQAAEAHRISESGRVAGKLVLSVR
jgi:NADPH:quinone reductase-like Zn-dependent oxidoreductase